jgi:hypothetical protein
MNKLGPRLGLSLFSFAAALYVFAPLTNHDFDPIDAPDAPPLASITVASSSANQIAVNTNLDAGIDVSPSGSVTAPST